MSNIAKTYYEKVNTKIWKQLHDLILEKKHYIHGIISSAEKESQTVKAHNALKQFSLFMA